MVADVIAANVGKAVVSETNVGKGKVIVLGAVPDDKSLVRIIRTVCKPQLEHSKNVVSVLRRGENTEGIIVAEFDGKMGEITLEKEMKDILTGNKYNGTVELKPYQLLVLQNV